MKKIFPLIAVVLLISCKKDSWKTDVTTESPTEVSNTIVGSYTHYEDNYEDGVGWNSRPGSFTVTSTSYDHEISGHRQILYYEKYPNRFRLHDTTVALENANYWTESIMEVIEVNSQFILFEQYNTVEKRHTIRWYK